MIQLFKPYICDEAKVNVLRVLDSGWIGLGPEVEAFEKEFASYIGTGYAVAFNSCTEALRVAVHHLESHNKCHNKLAISTPNTFVSTNHVLLQNGYEILFADIDPSTGNMDLDSVERLLSNYHPNLIMAVHYGGQSLDTDRLYKMAGEEGIEVIEDCAHACGSTYKKLKVGSWSWLACFSFHAVKNLPTGDGGMLVTYDKWVVEKAKKLRWLGIDKSTTDRTKGDGYSWEYDVPELGYKSHMNDITAAIGRAQLRIVDLGNKRRQELVNLYRKGLDGCETVQPLVQSTDSQSSNHLMVVRCKNREKVIQSLKENNIQFGCHYKPNYLYPMYQKFERENGCKGMEKFYREALTLPMHLFLMDKDVEQICEVIREVGDTCQG